MYEYNFDLFFKKILSHRLKWVVNKIHLKDKDDNEYRARAKPTSQHK